MTNLLVREAYPRSWLLHSRRSLCAIPIFSLYFGALGGAGALELGWVDDAIFGAFMGALFVVMFAGAVWPVTVRITDGLYYGNEDYSGPVPSGSFEYRLVCALTRKFPYSVGGVLYLGRGRVIFIAHRKNWRPDRYTIDFGPSAGFTIARRERPSQWYLRWLHRPEGYLEFRSPSATAQVYVPTPDAAFEALQKALDKLASQDLPARAN
jgi:hypothetical protein